MSRRMTMAVALLLSLALQVPGTAMAADAGAPGTTTDRGIHQTSTQDPGVGEDAGAPAEEQESPTPAPGTPSPSSPSADPTPDTQGPQDPGAVDDGQVQDPDSTGTRAPCPQGQVCQDGTGTQADVAGGTTAGKAASLPPVTGVIAAAWKAAGGAEGTLGVPTAPQETVAGGVYQIFTNGGLFARNGRPASVVRGAMLEAYVGAGGPSSYLGYPWAGEGASVRGAVYQEFDGGIGYWSASTGARFVHGAVYTAFVNQGWAGGRLGLPTGDETASARGGVSQAFQGGTVFWRPQRAATVVRGAMLEAYVGAGGPSSYLGYPTGAEWGTVRGGAVQAFDGGRAYWTPWTGAHIVHGAMLAWYRDAGAERGRHGFPTSDEYADRGSVRQDFEHGSLWWGGMPDGTYTHDVAWAGQPNGYFCGPTSGFMIGRYLGAWTSARGDSLSTNMLASGRYMNTVGYGYTSFHDRRFSAGMNSWLGMDVYRTIHAPSVATVRASVKNSFVTGYPTAVDAQERRGGPHYNGHPNSTFSHVMVVSGYDTRTDAVRMVDPGATVLWGGSRSFWYPSLGQFTQNFLQVEVELDGLQHIGIHTS